jgi:hypothetical protein
MLSLTPLQDKINSYLLNKENAPFIENGGLNRLLDDLFEKIIDVLPHGSGIDATWKLDQLGTLPIVLCHNSYHAMDSQGFYCGWIDFTVKLNLESLDFDVEVNKDNIKSIYAEYATEWKDTDPDQLDYDDPTPYLDDLDADIYQRISYNLELYLVRESIRYAKQFHPDILRQELEDSK